MQSRRDTSKPDAIRVGMCASLSGQFAVQGTQALHGVMAWVEDTNRRGGVFVRELSSSLPISFTHYDDRSRAADARELVRNLVVHDEVHLLLGPLLQRPHHGCCPSGRGDGSGAVEPRRLRRQHSPAGFSLDRQHPQPCR